MNDRPLVPTGIVPALNCQGCGATSQEPHKVWCAEDARRRAKQNQAQFTEQSGGGFRRAPEELDKPKRFIVVQQTEGHTAAYEMHVVVKPDGSQVLKGVHILSTLAPTEPGEELANALSRMKGAAVFVC
jgi:hypothetical protein